jgi:hypothetical protein
VPPGSADSRTRRLAARACPGRFRGEAPREAGLGRQTPQPSRGRRQGVGGSDDLRLLVEAVDVRPDVERGAGDPGRSSDSEGPASPSVAATRYGRRWARASSAAAPPLFRQPRSAASASRVKGTWRAPACPSSRQRAQAQTMTSRARAPSAGPASMRRTMPSWSLASSRRTSSPPRAPMAERQRPSRARLDSGPIGLEAERARHKRRRWPPRYRLGRRLPRRRGRLARSPGRGRAPAARGASCPASWRTAPPHSSRRRGGNRVGTRPAEPGRDPAPARLAETPSGSGVPETARDPPRAPAPTFNPPDAGSNPARPIRFAKPFSTSTGVPEDGEQ